MSETLSDANQLRSLSQAMADAVDKAGQATVLVDARRRMPASGILYAADLILTADHVVEREEVIRVRLPDGSDATAQLAGRDQGSDLALLRLESPAAQAAQAANREARVGQLALAVGRPSLQGVQASLGIITAAGGPLRTGRGGLLERYLLSDTIPYPGFSGGPLIDVEGLVIGLNTSGLTRGSALTIPVKTAWQIASILAEHGHVRHGYLGIRSQPVKLPEQARQAIERSQQVGLLLVWVEENSPAEKGGLMIGDIIVGIADQPIENPDELSGRLTGSQVGKETPVEILRGGQLQIMNVIVGERK
jgi:serine protease DegQ